jgi:hypothetical protein
MAVYWILVQYEILRLLFKTARNLGLQFSNTRADFESAQGRISMSSTTISLIVLACVFGGALLGIFLHAVLPQHHLSSKSKDIVKLGMGLLGTMAALVLGLLVASAKGSYDAQSAELTQLSANIAVLDRGLGLYGPETKEIRAMLRGAVVRILDQMWSKDGASQRRQALPAVKFSTKKFRGSRRRTTRNARSKARR